VVIVAGRSAFPYQRIVEDLRSEILLARRKPGERLPSEHDLAKQYGTSRPTVRRAIAVLKAEGLVVTEQGRGAFVRPTPHVRLLVSGTNYRRHRRAGLSGFNAQAVEQGQAPQQDVLEVTTIGAPFEVSMRLNLDEGAPVVMRRRLFRLDGHPVAFCDSYYPVELVEGTAIADNENIDGGVHALIEDPAGPIRRVVARSVDDLVARMPTPDEVRGLALPPGMPVVRVIRTIYDSDDNPIEVQDTVAAADRHSFRYEVSMR
jgi:GntR family transcriptional regulator